MSSCPSRPALRLAPPQVSRRNALRLTGVSIGAAWLLGQTATPVFATGDGSATDDDFELIAQRWTTFRTGNRDIDATDPDFTRSIQALQEEAQGFIDSYIGAEEGLWEDSAYAAGSPSITRTALRLRRIATAIITPGTSQFESSELTDLVMAGMLLFTTTGFAPTVPVTGNTWDWGIGTPGHLSDAATFLREHLTEEVRTAVLASLNAFNDPMAGSTGANLTDLCVIELKTACLERNGERIATAMAYIPDSFDYATDGDGSYGSRDGMHADGSFIQHDRVPYTGTYGESFLNGVARLAALTHGTAWEITDPRLENVFETAVRGFIPMVYDGLMMDTVRGRAVARETQRDVNNGFGTAIALLTLARADNNAERAAFMRSAAKGMFTRAVSLPYAEHASPAALAIAKTVMNDRSIEVAEEPAAHNQFPDMSRAVHRRPGWAFAIAQSSSRASYYEALNGENPRGWHASAGAGWMYLHEDNAHYNDNYWNTVDPYRLPGTTVQNKPLPNAYGSNWNPPGVTWVGGSVLDGMYGAVGADHKTLGSNLVGRKSWFCFDEGVVALGAGITASAASNADVETILENRKLLDPTARFRVDGDRQLHNVGEEATYSPRWLHLEGVAGYILLDNQTLRCARIERSGAWSEIGGGSSEVRTRTYLQIIREHGAAPFGGAYAYAILPGASVATTRRLERQERFEIITNRPEVQAVADTRANIRMFNFFAAGTVGGVTVDAPCSVIIREGRVRNRRAGDPRTRLDVAIADPTRGERTIEVSFDIDGYRNSTSSPEVTVHSTEPIIRITADLQGVRGTSVFASITD